MADFPGFLTRFHPSSPCSAERLLYAWFSHGKLQGSSRQHTEIHKPIGPYSGIVVKRWLGRKYEKKKISVQVLFGVVSKKKKKKILALGQTFQCARTRLQGSLVSWLLRTLDHAVTLLREFSPLDHRFNRAVHIPSRGRQFTDYFCLSVSKSEEGLQIQKEKQHSSISD